MVISVKGVMARSMVDALSAVWFLFKKGGNSAFIAVIASDLFPHHIYKAKELVKLWFPKFRCTFPVLV